jgi:hypothetical protein
VIRFGNGDLSIEGVNRWFSPQMIDLLFLPQKMTVCVFFVDANLNFQPKGDEPEWL